jgi:hypothetical protein
LKSQPNHLWERAELYGYSFFEEGICVYLIYGVVPINRYEEAEFDNKYIQMTTFFKDYEIIGYVNLHRITREEKQPEGCYVFYEANEAMQEFLLSRKEENKLKEEVSRFPSKTSKSIARNMIRGRLVQKLLLSMLLLTAALATVIINHYREMSEFAVMAAKAIQEIR